MPQSWKELKASLSESEKALITENTFSQDLFMKFKTALEEKNFPLERNHLKEKISHIDPSSVIEMASPNSLPAKELTALGLEAIRDG